jgi:hypothetical protein
MGTSDPHGNICEAGPLLANGGFRRAGNSWDDIMHSLPDIPDLFRGTSDCLAQTERRVRLGWHQTRMVILQKTMH